MKRFYRKALIYLLAVAMVAPAWLANGMFSATKAEAAIEPSITITSPVTGTTVNGDKIIEFSSVGTQSNALCQLSYFDGANYYFSNGNVSCTSGANKLSDLIKVESNEISFNDLPDGSNFNLLIQANDLLSGSPVSAEVDNLTKEGTLVLSGTLSAEDFGVNSNTGPGTVNGYATGFGLTGATFAGATSVVVKLYSGATEDTLLQTNTSTAKFGTDVTGVQFSSPFDIMGTFDYVTDGYWINVRETQYGQSVPATRVMATVTLANGKIVTATNENPTGDYATINTNAGTLSAEDFGVVNYETGLGILAGYTAGFGLTDATFAGTTSVIVKLYAGVAGDQLLQTNTAIIPKFNEDIKGTQFSSPFDVSGAFKYATDGYWTNVRESEFGQSIPATKVEATVTLANGKVVTAENTSLTGVPTTIYPPVVITLPVPLHLVAVAGNGEVSLTWDAVAGASGYVISYKKTSDSVFGTSIPVTGTSTKIINLTNGVSYDFRVAAKGSNGVVGAQATTTASPVAPKAVSEATTTPVIVGPVASVAPTTVQAAPPVEPKVEAAPSDDNGQIKSEETTSDKEDINWTPWIVLFVLILLAGAATGGYFYWFAGSEDENVKPVAKEEKQIEKKAPVKNNSKAPNRKSKRW